VFRSALTPEHAERWCSVDEEFVPASPLEGDGFELSVPRVMSGRFWTTGPAAIAGFGAWLHYGGDSPNYVGFRRDAVVLHMQFQFEHEMGTIRLRFLVENPDALFNEYRQRGVECTPNGVRDTPWGTREFALYDLDRNALYRELTSAEKERRSS
jgi:hypothetical protein